MLISPLLLYPLYLSVVPLRVDFSESPDANTRLWYESRLDLNNRVFDAGRYKPNDNWFTNRWEDIISIRRISYNEAVAVYERLSSLDDEQYNHLLYSLTASSMSTKYHPDGDLINSFLIALDKYQPSSLSEIAKRIASSLKGGNTRSELFNKLKNISWILLLTAIEQNPETGTSETFETEFIDALGGSRDFGALLFFNHYKAIVSGDLDEALLSVKLAATANRLFPNSLPEYISVIAASDNKSVEEFVESFEGFEDIDRIALVSSVVWGYPGRRSESFDYFSSFAKRVFGFSDEEFEKLAREILYLKLGEFR